MFSFHKPRVYRSVEGCCICRAKSSSSRFTDSRRYELDSMKCFDLKYPRQGEICNACVLLVKRYKRLPVGSTRHWGHVVDARAGPGTKAMSRYKKHRDHSSETSGKATSPSKQVTSRSRSQNKNIITEKFTKIFKKTKKTTTSTTTPKLNASSNSQQQQLQKNTAAANKRRATTVSAAASAWTDARVDSLPTTPDSLDSDYEDTDTNSAVGNGSGGGGGAGVGAGSGSIAVQFQTQTRACTYRTRHSAGNTANAVANRKTTVRKLGSKRRKCLPPRRHRRLNYAEKVQFFDEIEWQERKSCCGMVYECNDVPGTLLLDLAYYKPCAEHQRRQQQQQPPLSSVQTPVAPAPVLPVPIAVSTNAIVAPAVQSNPTPALKKHHLFFKRQSECFPHGDGATNNYNSSNSNSNTPLNVKMSTPAAIAAVVVAPLGSSAYANSTANIVPRHSTAKVATISTATTSVANAHASNVSGKAHNFLHKLKTDTGKIGKHSLDKVTTPSATVARLKSVDVPEVKQLIKNVDKSYMLTTTTGKPTITAISAPPQQVSQQHQSVYHTQLQLQQPQPYATSTGTLLTTAMASPSPTLSSSSSTSISTKFSDNSSDSGFDENMQDRKSASPLQEDMERKLLTRSGVQTMFLASGVQIQGQQQNLILTGNEMAAKLLQTRKQNATITSTTLNSNGQHQHMQNTMPTTATAISNNNRLGTAATAVKIAQIIGAANTINNSSSSSSSSNSNSNSNNNNSNTTVTSHAKMRTIYNNNTIQHENGITTIVPASSLAACSQTAAMHSAVGPSTVTITPAPHSMKMTSGAGVNANNAAHLNAINMSNSQHHHHQQQHHAQMINNNINNSVVGVSSGNGGSGISNLNQKFILVKTATKYNSGTAAGVIAAAATNTNTTTSSATTIKTLNN